MAKEINKSFPNEMKLRIGQNSEKEKLRLGNKLNYGSFSNSKWRQV